MVPACFESPTNQNRCIAWHQTPLSAPLQPNEVPTKPWEVVSVDLIGELPESQGLNAICVFVDRFSKQIHLAPVTTELTSAGMAKLYRDHIVSD